MDPYGIQFFDPGGNSGVLCPVTINLTAHVGCASPIKNTHRSSYNLLDSDRAFLKAIAESVQAPPKKKKYQMYEISVMCEHGLISHESIEMSYLRGTSGRF